MDLQKNITVEIISKSAIRYKGIYNKTTNNNENVILTQVHSYGTENRPCKITVKTSQKIYEKLSIKMNNIKKYREDDGEWIFLDDKTENITNSESMDASNNTDNIKTLASRTGTYENIDRIGNGVLPETLSSEEITRLANIRAIQEKCQSNAECDSYYGKKPYGKKYGNYSSKSKYKNWANNTYSNDTSYSSANVEKNRFSAISKDVSHLDVDVPNEDFNLKKDKNKRVVDKEELKKNSKRYYDADKDFYDHFGR